MDQVTFCTRCGEGCGPEIAFCFRCGTQVYRGGQAPPVMQPTVAIAPEIVESIPSARVMSRRRLHARAQAAVKPAGVGSSLLAIAGVLVALTLLAVLVVRSGNAALMWIVGALGGTLFFFWAIYMVVRSANRGTR